MMSSEKEEQPLLPSSVAPGQHHQQQEARSLTSRRIRIVFFALLAIGLILYDPKLTSRHWHSKDSQHHASSEPLCPQIAPLVPVLSGPRLADMQIFLDSAQFRNDSISRMTNAVKIPSMSYDDLGAIGEDPRWDVFYDFEKYLEATFPNVHNKLKKDVVNTHGLLYTWEGSDSDLKPTLLMAHQDVVPVEKSTFSAWTHPPFSGHYDGKYIWGRGASDCKNQLIAILESIELLIAAEWTPQRTILLSFGFDEEISGREGAGSLAPFIQDRYGRDSLAAIVDEGAGFSTSWGQVFAAPAVAEKGYTDVTITVRMPGGHSSIPPSHTGIGVLSELITMIEEHLYPPHLDDKNPFLGALQCGSEHSPDFPSKLRHLIKQRSKKHGGPRDILAEEAAKISLATRYLMQTSQAVDIIGGGAKVNALPERVSAIVNHRINIGEHPSDAQAKIESLAKKVAKKYSLGLHAYDNIEEASSIMLSASNTTLEAAPVTPTTLLSSDGKLTPWAILSGTTRALYGSDIIMAPYLSTGNTDTRYYWDLTKHIFRYGPGYDAGEEGLGGIHTINERVSVAAHVNAVKWFGTFVRNMDEAEMA